MSINNKPVNATIYNKKKPIIEVVMESGVITDIRRIREKEFLPICLQKDMTIEKSNRWLSKRKIPKNREGLEEATILFGDYLQFRNMFSLSDQYWVKYQKNDTWEKGNFFTNRYSNAVGRSFFIPWELNKKEVRQQGPDLTTNGVLRKVWMQDEHKESFLIKAGSRKFHQEPISEVLSSFMLKHVNFIPFVEYTLYVYGYRMCSKCKGFVTKDTEFIPFKQLYDYEPRKENETPYDHVLRACDAFEIIGAKEYIDKMILADILIGNKDRHLGNFGVLRNANTAKIEGFSPLFDFGSAFWGKQDEEKRKVKTMFNSVEKEVLKRNKEYLASKLPENEELLFSFIDMYPEITIAEKQEIKKGIIRRRQLIM